MKKKDQEMPLTDVAGLMAERQQYESWLEALASRRDSTPQHVYERVLKDYEGRLQRVLEKLSTHRADLEQRLAELEHRASGLAADERTRRDERAELDLRAHVGELTSEAFDRAVADCDREIADVVAQRAALAEEIQRMRDFLDAANRPPTPVAQLAVSPTAQTPPTGVAAITEEPRSQQLQLAPPEATEAASAPNAGEKLEPEQPKPEYPQPRTRSGGFDELAFLQQVVGQAHPAPAAPAPVAPAPVAAPPEPPVPEPAAASEAPRRPSRRTSKPEWIAEHSLEPMPTDPDMEIVHEEPDMPLAANVTGNNPIVLRPSGQIEHSKTLKCSECGAMNYPTEWYCERCGAELASL